MLHNQGSEYVIFIVFHYNNGCTNPSQYYVIRIFPVLLTSIRGSRKVKPSGSPFLLYQHVPGFNLLKPTVHVMHHQSNIQQLYALPTLYLCFFFLVFVPE